MKKLYIAIRSNTQFMIDCCLLMHKNAIKMSLQKKVFIVVYFVRLLLHLVFFGGVAVFYRWRIFLAGWRFFGRWRDFLAKKHI